MDYIFLLIIVSLPKRLEGFQAFSFPGQKLFGSCVLGFFPWTLDWVHSVGLGGEKPALDDNLSQDKGHKRDLHKFLQRFFSLQRANVNLLGFWFMAPLFLPPVLWLTLLWSDILLHYCLKFVTEQRIFLLHAECSTLCSPAQQLLGSLRLKSQLLYFGINVGPLTSALSACSWIQSSPYQYPSSQFQLPLIHRTTQDEMQLGLQREFKENLWWNSEDM